MAKFNNCDQPKHVVHSLSVMSYIFLFYVKFTPNIFKTSSVWEYLLAEPYCKSLIIYDMTRKSYLYLISHLRYSDSVILFAQSCDVDFLRNA